MHSQFTFCEDKERITPGAQQLMGDEDESSVGQCERFPQQAYLKWSSSNPGSGILQTATTKEQFLKEIKAKQNYGVNVSY